MTQKWGFVFACLFSLLLALPLAAETLRWVGVVGNSGEMGKTLLRTTNGRGGGGVLLDHAGHLVTAGGDAILVLDKSGKLLWETKITNLSNPAGPPWVLGGASFALQNDYLYFLAGVPKAYTDNLNLYLIPDGLLAPNVLRLKLAPGAVPELLITEEKIRWLPKQWNSIEFTLASQPKSGDVYLGWNTNVTGPAPELNVQSARAYEIFKIDVAGKKLLPTFKFNADAGFAVGRFAFDETGDVYLGWNDLRKYSGLGKPAPGFAPVPFPSTGEGEYYGAAMFQGTLNLTKDALWLTTFPGFIGRFTRELKPAPGVVSARNFALCSVTQIIDDQQGGYYLKSDDALYHARIENNQLQLQQRFGALPRVDGLAVTPSGYVGVGNNIIASGMLWFPFASTDPAVAPVRAEGPGPIAQGIVDGYPDGDGGLLSCTFADPTHSLKFTPRETAISLRKFLPVSATVDYWTVPKLKFWTGKCSGRLISVTRLGTLLLGIDAENNTLLGATLPDGDFSALEGFPALTDYLTSLATLDAHTILLAEGNIIHAFQITDGAITELWQFKQFGANDKFGAELYLAYSRKHLIVADSKRQRVLLFAVTNDKTAPLSLLAQIGATDQPGDDNAHLNTPTLVSISGEKAVVYDSLNQRVVKMIIEE